MTIGDKIKTVRMMKGYSQEYVAKKIGITGPAFSNIEINKTDISWSRLNEIAAALETTVSELTTFGEKNVFHISGGVNNLCGNGVVYFPIDLFTFVQKVEDMSIRLAELEKKHKG